MLHVPAFVFSIICSREKKNAGKKVLDNIQLMKTSKNNVSNHSIMYCEKFKYGSVFCSNSESNRD